MASLRLPGHLASLLKHKPGEVLEAAQAAGSKGKGDGVKDTSGAGRVARRRAAREKRKAKESAERAVAKEKQRQVAVEAAERVKRQREAAAKAAEEATAQDVVESTPPKRKKKKLKKKGQGQITTATSTAAGDGNSDAVLPKRKGAKQRPPASSCRVFDSEAAAADEELIRQLEGKLGFAGNAEKRRRVERQIFAGLEADGLGEEPPSSDENQPPSEPETESARPPSEDDLSSLLDGILSKGSAASRGRKPLKKGRPGGSSSKTG
eukprot:TRINITY_DN78916_c0_g1_i1.p1 TRINITY_DN78916_c0_g1~~TRINITY_DN78916_c0_g1_i1.p1  ORF type:complete len:281 (-),score=73.72 TRINITY_DN78916_c0_g1_i1:28-822(-)